MAVIQPHWTYWGNAFVAQLLMPISCDVLFTVGLIVITDVFPEDTQALAGAVFNTASQFGNAFGLAIMQIVSTTVTKDKEKHHDPHAVMDGFRASFWTMFGITVVYSAWGVLGLRKTGRVGVKRD
jgi:MFS family permease